MQWLMSATLKQYVCSWFYSLVVYHSFGAGLRKLTDIGFSNSNYLTF